MLSIWPSTEIFDVSESTYDFSDSFSLMLDETFSCSELSEFLSESTIYRLKALLHKK